MGTSLVGRGGWLGSLVSPGRPHLLRLWAAWLLGQEVAQTRHGSLHIKQARPAVDVHREQRRRVPREGLCLLDARTASDHPRDEQHSEAVEVGNVPEPVAVAQEVARLHPLPVGGGGKPSLPGCCEVAPEHPGGSAGDAREDQLSGGKAREPHPQGLDQGIRQRLHIPLPSLAVACLDCAGRRAGIEVEGVCGEAPQFARPEAGRGREAIAHRAGRAVCTMLGAGSLLGHIEEPSHLVSTHLATDMLPVGRGVVQTEVEQGILGSQPLLPQPAGEAFHAADVSIACRERDGLLLPLLALGRAWAPQHRDSRQHSSRLQLGKSLDAGSGEDGEQVPLDSLHMLGGIPSGPQVLDVGGCMLDNRLPGSLGESLLSRVEQPFASLHRLLLQFPA